MADQKADQKWGNLVGKSFEEAEKAIKDHDSNLEVVKLAEGSPTTRDFRFNRVRVFVDKHDKVVEQPKNG